MSPDLGTAIPPSGLGLWKHFRDSRKHRLSTYSYGFRLTPNHKGSTVRSIYSPAKVPTQRPQWNDKGICYAEHIGATGGDGASGDRVAGRIRLIEEQAPVISTREALALNTDGRRAGADTCLLVMPYSMKPTLEGMIRHFLEVLTVSISMSASGNPLPNSSIKGNGIGALLNKFDDPNCQDVQAPGAYSNRGRQHRVSWSWE